MEKFCSFIKSNIDFNNETIRIGKLINIKTEDIYIFTSKIIKIIFIIILMYLLIRISNHIINKFVEKQKKLKFSLDDKKSKTLGAILKSIVKYTVYFLGIVAIIQIFFGKIVLTFAGIGGVALGLGAQSLIKDVINGFFILLEDQFSVGEYIGIEDKSGIVESIELRVTKLRDFNGDLHIIPNGLITKVTNHSRGNMRVLVDVDIAYEEDVDNAINIISQVCSTFKEKNKDIKEGPNVLGISELKDCGVTIRVVAKAKPMTQWAIEMELRKEIKKQLDINNIEIPYPKIQIIKEE
ncbi:putative MscS family protein YkuT [Clostridium acetireducens DSM 10703]|uniref:Putative MscS family protein YkuT n=1 Tax=Clostridium acetireducens DSM 10703 TaxID=1121290 RepID=A0A1E8EX92_9CLOT|nr:mechanosensitive ion channel family protein [Clostridium acetireducens]OFI05386.1 putative MscS family protein YkuT [Clostridium acetireducens DSM 10703]